MNYKWHNRTGVDKAVKREMDLGDVINTVVSSQQCGENVEMQPKTDCARQAFGWREREACDRSVRPTLLWWADTNRGAKKMKMLGHTNSP